MFALLKWYFDLVTDTGTAMVLYATRLQWGRLRAGYASVLYSAPGGLLKEEATMRGVKRPRLLREGLTWQSEPLGVVGTWTRPTPSKPIRRTLIRGSTGHIRWTCYLPSARARVRYGDRELAGTGYVESLRLTIPPWKLPFNTLRWGRYASDRHSLVWIDWAGTRCQRWCWLDGLEQPGARLTETGVEGLSDGSELRLEGSRDIRDRRVLATLTDIAPGLSRRLAGRLARMHEHKVLDRSALVRVGEPRDRGWTLHEVVTW
jgi:hypothetical protein